MKTYEKPVADVLTETSEGVYAASGDNSDDKTPKPTPKKCRFGRVEASAGSDVCQSCSATGGTTPDKKGTYRDDYKGCIEGMPEKE